MENLVNQAYSVEYKNCKPGETLNNLRASDTHTQRHEVESAHTSNDGNRGDLDRNTCDYYDDEEETDLIDEDLPHHSVLFFIKNFFISLVPNWTPILMCGTDIVVSTFLCFFRASEGGTPQLIFFTLFVIFSIIIWLFFLLLRLVIVNILCSNGLVKQSKLYNILVSILNPEGFYLACTIFSVCFWSRAIVQVNDVDVASDVNSYALSANQKLFYYRFLGIGSLTALASPVDIEILQKTQFFLIVWASRDVVMNIGLFLFLLGFMKNVNKNLVEFLTLYYLVRKLNANWIRLAPIVNKLSRSSLADLNQTDSITESGDGLGGKKLLNKTVDLNCTSSSKGDLILSFDLDTKLRDGSKHEESASFLCSSGCRSRQRSYLRQPSRPAAQVVDELLSVEARSKLKNKPKKSFHRGPPSNTPLARLQSTTPPDIKQRKSELDEVYQVEYDGTEFPPELLKENIEETERNGLVNFLTVNYVHNHPVALFVRGVRVELYSKYLARLVGCRLFEELIEFRDEVAPDRDLSAEQLDIFVKNTVMGALEEARLQRFMNRSRDNTDVPKKHKARRGFFGFRFPLKTADDKSFSSTSQALTDVCKKLTVPHPKRHSTDQKNVYSINLARTATQSVENQKVRQRLPSNSRKIEEGRQAATGQSQKSFADFPLSEQQEIKPSVDGPAVSLLRLKSCVLTQNAPAGASRQYLTLELFRILLGDDVQEFMKYADPGGRDRVSIKQFTRLIVDLYQMRKQLIAHVDSQKGIQNVFQRMMSIFLGFICFLIFLVVAGVSATTIAISGAASIASLTAALSFLYSGFIQSVMFVCFLTPYNVGDRVRLNGELLIVKKVSTYFSEFVSVPHNKPSFWNHSLLYKSIIVNESRCRNAGLEIPLLIAYNTEPVLYDELRDYIENYVNTDPELVKGSLFLLLNELVLGDYMKCTYWITCTESWHHWKAVYSTRTRVLLAIARKCQLLGITYRLPIQPVKLSNQEIFNVLEQRIKSGS